jgi:energy-dependent translational throttle protein EttA
MALLGEVMISVTDLSKAIGPREILKPMTFTVHKGHRIGIVGVNGSGKSTFLRLMAGEDKDHGGELRWAHGARIGYVPQEPRLDETKTVLENIQTGVAHVQRLLDEYNQVSTDMGSADPDEMDKLMDRMTKLQEEIDQKNAWELDHQLELAMEALRVPEGDKPVTNLSGGEKRRVALCRELISHPDLLLLDEPTNHLDASSIEWLEAFLGEYAGTVIVVTHDRYFMDNLMDFMVEIEDGRLNIFEGSYSDYLRQKAEWLDKTQKKEEKRQKLLRRELDWMGGHARAHVEKNKMRAKRYEQLMSEGVADLPGESMLRFPVPPRLGSQVVKVEGLKKKYGERTIFQDLAFTLAPGEILGVVGPNGVGKTTLFRLLTGQETPDAGTIEMGQTVKPVYLEQGRETLHDEKTVYDEVAEGAEQLEVGSEGNKKRIHVREYLNWFTFKGTIQQTPVGKLSGGERNRLLLAKALRKGGNLLLLDEPTNDLDLQTLRVLEEGLENWPGSAILISHDRFFLDRLVTALLVFEEDGGVRWVDGNFETYFEIRKKELEKSGKGKGKMLKTTYRRMKKAG